MDLNPWGLTTDSEIVDKLFNNNQGLLKFIDTYKVGFTLFFAVATIVVIIMLIFNVVRLANAGDNPSTKQLAYHGILVCAICLIILGGFDTVFAILLSIILSA